MKISKKEFSFMKKGYSDQGYLKRIVQRYRDLRQNSEKYALLTEEEMFQTYLDLMDFSYHLYNAKVEEL